MNNKKNRKLVVASMLGAITIALGLTPLGFIPLGFINATTMHIPVIIAGILEGPIVGMAVGLIFGLSSLFNAITRPTPMSIVFYNPLISILPRVLIGLFSYYAYAALSKIDHKKSKKFSYLVWAIIVGLLVYLLVTNIRSGQATAMAIVMNIVLLIVAGIMLYLMNKKNLDLATTVGAFVGSMTNTVFVMGGIYFLYAAKYMEIVGRPLEDAATVVMGVVVTSGIPEAIISVIITTAVVSAVNLSRGRSVTSSQYNK
jgi:uncharacterized membrane protein